MPLANNFLKSLDDVPSEEKFPLGLCFCDQCKLVQLNYIVPPEKMFKDYVYVSSTSPSFRSHFEDMAKVVFSKFGLDGSSLVVDIGSNDGVLLKPFKSLGVQVVGVEPASNIAKIAEENGVETINDFFNEGCVQKIIPEHGKADVITANNVFAHIPDIHEVVINVKSLLKEQGVFVIEFQYFVDTVKTMTFDNIYHEHFSYYTLTSLNYFFKNHEMQIFDVQHVDTHGGSLRVYVQKLEGENPVNDVVGDILDKESKFGVNEISLYLDFATDVKKVKANLIEYIKNILLEGKKISGYGAPAKGNTLLNFCRINSSQIDYIVEDNNLKVGLFTPGSHIPVVKKDELIEDIPDYVLILAWNFAEEIIEKIKNLREKGVKFIVPLPEPRIV